MTDVRLALEHIGKRWGRVAALTDISLQVPRGMFLSLLGPSGCGKTTLLRVIAGIWRRMPAVWSWTAST